MPRLPVRVKSLFFKKWISTIVYCLYYSNLHRIGASILSTDKVTIFSPDLLNGLDGSRIQILQFCDEMQKNSKVSYVISWNKTHGFYLPQDHMASNCILTKMSKNNMRGTQRLPGRHWYGRDNPCSWFGRPQSAHEVVDLEVSISRRGKWVMTQSMTSS